MIPTAAWTRLAGVSDVSISISGTMFFCDRNPYKYLVASRVMQTPSKFAVLRFLAYRFAHSIVVYVTPSMICILISNRVRIENGVGRRSKK